MISRPERRNFSRVLLPFGLLLAVAGCETQSKRLDPASVSLGPPPEAQSDPAQPTPESPEVPVRSTIVPGLGPSVAAAARPTAPVRGPVRRGEVTLNFVGVEIPVVAKAVMGEVLQLPYSVDPTLNTQMSLQVPYPVAKSEVLGLFEDSLRNAGFVLIKRGSVHVIQPMLGSQGTRIVGAADTGYGDETLQLTYASATELKRLLDPILPNTIAMADPGRNVIILSGSTAQRRAAREMISQFDVDWMRGMSFGLIVPRRTDARLIAPELEKLLNSPGSSTAGMVRLLPMERLNGIIAITSQPAFLSEVQRWVEVLDREGESSQPRLHVYRVQNGRSADLAKVLASALGTSAFVPASGTASPFGSGDDRGGSNSGGAGNPQSGQNAGLGQPGSNPSRGAGVEIDSGAPALFNARPGVPTIGSDETNNAVVVFTTPREYAVIEDALRKLDVPPLQVMIDAVISEVTLNNNLRYGVQWFLDEGSRQTSFTSGSTNQPTQIFPGLSFLFNNGSDIRATLNALRDVTDVDVLSAPKLMVLNNHTASLQIGDQVPVKTSEAVDTSGGNSPLVTTVEYRDTGVILKVTPRVNDSGLVLLDIAQEVSDVTDTRTSDIDSPTIQQRRLATSVAVRDGQTISLGGLIRVRKEVGRARVPLLGDVPYAGQLFGSTERDSRRTELLILLTPRVVRTAVDAEQVTEELRRLIRAVAPAPVPVK